MKHIWILTCNNVHPCNNIMITEDPFAKNSSYLWHCDICYKFSMFHRQLFPYSPLKRMLTKLYFNHNMRVSGCFWTMSSKTSIFATGRNLRERYKRGSDFISKKKAIDTIRSKSCSINFLNVWDLPVVFKKGQTWSFYVFISNLARYLLWFMYPWQLVPHFLICLSGQIEMFSLQSIKD